MNKESKIVVVSTILTTTVISMFTLSKGIYTAFYIDISLHMKNK